MMCEISDKAKLATFHYKLQSLVGIILKLMTWEDGF